MEEEGLCLKYVDSYKDFVSIGSDEDIATAVSLLEDAHSVALQLKPREEENAFLLLHGGHLLLTKLSFSFLPFWSF